MTSYSSSVSRIGSVFSHPLGQNVSTCGTPQIRRHRGGLGMGAFLPLYSVYSNYSTLSRKSNFSKAATFSVLICVLADIRCRRLRVSHVRIVRLSTFDRTSQGILFRIVRIDVHRVDILRAGRADFNDLPLKFLHQCRVLGFRIAHNYIVIRHQKRIGDFSLGREGFTGTGSTQNQPVGVFELFPVNHNQVVGPVSYTHLGRSRLSKKSMPLRRQVRPQRRTQQLAQPKLRRVLPV